MVSNGSHYFIPVVASIHTHTPCRADGTNGVSHNVSDDDHDLASNHPDLRNWIIGCNAIAKFDRTNQNYFDIKTGNLSVICNEVN